MSRADISGQFPIDNICTACIESEHVKIDRYAISSSIQYNWSELCDSVDAVLTGYEAARNQMSTYVTLAIVLMFIGTTYPSIFFRFLEVSFHSWSFSAWYGGK